MGVWRPRVWAQEAIYDPRRVPTAAGSDASGPVGAITRWIPIEVIAFFEGITQPFGNQIAPYLLYCIAAGLIATFLWIAFATADAQAKSVIAWRQVVLSCISFFFWVVGTTNSEVWALTFKWWHPGFGPAGLALGAILIPIVDGVLKRLRVPQD